MVETVLLLACAAFLGLLWGRAGAVSVARAALREVDQVVADVDALRGAVRKLSGHAGRATRDEEGLLKLLLKAGLPLGALPNGAGPQHAADCRCPTCRAKVLAAAGFGR